MKNTIVTLCLLAALAVSAVAQDDRPARPERPDPATMAKQMLTDHDADKSGTLNKAELEKALTAMRANRPQGPQQGRQGARTERSQQGDRPERGERQQQGERPQRPEGANFVDMFMQRNDADENGELSAKELESALSNMGRGRPQGPAQRQRQRPQEDR